MLPLDLVLTTQNYRLRKTDETDIEFAFAASRFPGFNDGMQWDPPKAIAEMIALAQRNHKRWLDGYEFTFTIETVTKPYERLGRISIRKTDSTDIWNVGFWTHPNHHGKGIMTEALGKVIELGFTELDAIEVTSDYAIWNKASERVMVKNGLQLVEFMEKGFKKKGEWVAKNKYGIKRSEWHNLRKG
ncbi:MAG: GNAT family protein [Bacteroidota bacterium]